MTFKESNDLEDFIGKLDWEGGTYSALQYGLSTEQYNLPDEVAEKWDEIRDAFGELETLEGEFFALVKAHGVDY
jgi:hypothetical protein